MLRTLKWVKQFKVSKMPTALFLNHTEMTLTNFQWISTKIRDLHKLFVEDSNINFFVK